MSYHANTNIAAAVITAGAVSGAYLTYRLYQESRKVKLPDVWTQVGTLSDLYTYPIKSCGPVKLDKAECTVLGLRYGWLRDRTLMVIDDNNNFITARAYPELLKVHPLVKSSVLQLKNDDMDTIYVNLAEVMVTSTPKTAYVWKCPVPVYDCGLEASEWFTRLINRHGKNYRLVYYASQESRVMRDISLKYFNVKKDDTGAFPDELSYNLINEASIAELNSRLTAAQVTHRNFRPNFVLKGGSAYTEDNWKFVKIGENIFEILKPCTRCVLTTIDPETGVRNSEVLATLKSYRQIVDPKERKLAGNSPRLGLQMALRSGPGGLVSVDDPIYVA